jgi:DNA (cytosine-5)-methyltransferase 1
MRFELANSWSVEGVKWAVRFYFGPSKDIRSVELDGSVTIELRQNDRFADLLDGFQHSLQQAHALLERTNPDQLQNVWTHRADGVGPFDVTDRLGDLAKALHDLISAELDEDGRIDLGSFVVEIANGDNEKLVSRAKLERHAVKVIAGILIGDWFNSLPWHERRKAAA